ncbi:MAG: hypothetical protein K0U18_06260 [Betaproteobacteria bacterium]|jgi:DNA-binding response OmpR family regulator|nr:hypothetical protein [Betaproteobacteria bacterium]MDG1096838.1 hypothetical protein [Methylophilaceae bacterium]MDG1454533.1 hypothetical protein [Methylophilaceae bacterium]
MRILIIEDDHDVSTFIAKVLIEARHLAEISSDGNEGLLQATTAQC